MDKKYWDEMSPKYEAEIFDVLKNDKHGIIKSRILEFASPKKTVADIGCAVGKWLPLLSSSFEKVYALDHSEKYTAYAQAKFGKKENIDFITADMTRQPVKVPPSDVLLCVNAILINDSKKRAVFFKNLNSCLKKKGHLVLVVPSLESALYSEFRGGQWNEQEGIKLKSSLSAGDTRRFNELKRGVIELDNIPTKHYLKEELEITLQNEGFQVLHIEKVEYTWATEFDGAPAKMKGPFPWDWVVSAQKK